MATSSSTTEKPTQKTSRVLPSNYHLEDKSYAGFIHVGGVGYQTEWYDDAEEAALSLRCLEKEISYELIETMEGEGYFPERARIIEDKYQQSGKADGLYTGLNMKDGAISDNASN